MARAQFPLNRNSRDCYRHCVTVLLGTMAHVGTLHAYVLQQVSLPHQAESCAIEAAKHNSAPGDRDAFGSRQAYMLPHEHLRTERKCARLFAASRNCAPVIMTWPVHVPHTLVAAKTSTLSGKLCDRCGNPQQWTVRPLCGRCTPCMRASAQTCPH